MLRAVLVLCIFALFLHEVVHCQENETGSANTLLLAFTTHHAISFTAEQICRIAPGLNNAQRQVCVQSPQSIGILQSSAVNVFQDECQYQFRNERWNCSGSVPPFFGDTSRELNRATKENAFVHALTSAAAVHAVTSACSEGRINGCTCDTRLNGETTPEGALWGGCSDNVEYGVRFARDFLDARETHDLANKTTKQSELALVNLHNNKVGRKVVQHSMKTRCKCHGVSGSCSMKTCWRVISTMREIGQILKSQHINALRVSIEHRSIGPAVLRTVGSSSMTPMLDNHLVYIKTSINYCIKNRNYTIGRECAPRDLLKKVKLGLPLPAGQINKEAPVCEDICCGQLFRLDRTVSSYYCNCRFIWCCDILCDICTATVDKYHCIS